MFCICAVIIISSVKKPDLYWYFLFGLALIIIAAIFVTVYLLMHQGAENFRFVRIRAWLHPEEYAADEGLHGLLGRYAFGAVGFWGLGLGECLI